MLIVWSHFNVKLQLLNNFTIVIKPILISAKWPKLKIYFCAERNFRSNLDVCFYMKWTNFKTIRSSDIVTHNSFGLLCACVCVLAQKVFVYMCVREWIFWTTMKVWKPINFTGKFRRTLFDRCTLDRVSLTHTHFSILQAYFLKTRYHYSIFNSIQIYCLKF